jgi:hypothetical protein
VFFVGLSKLRNASTSRLPLASRAETLVCGLAAVDRDSGAVLGWLALDDFEKSSMCGCCPAS